ncbi:MAG TPA: PIN domain-containing protein [Thermofilum sp.]|nr:PIN domain-containing protein [Thermofilum sp.]
MSGKLLFDASSMLYALKLKKLRIIYDNYIQWLTIYEVTNALWKEASLIGSMSLSEASKIVKLFTEAVEFTKLLNPHPYEEEILAIADELEITAYDASYVFLAKQKGLSLVTEDKKLRKKAEKLIKVTSLSQII